MFNALIVLAERCSLSAASFAELSIVLQVWFAGKAFADLAFFIRTAQIEIMSFNREQAELPRNAFALYGKGRHRAGLNFGDCCSYALAQFLDEPLLFKRDDFLYTDLRLAAG